MEIFSSAESSMRMEGDFLEVAMTMPLVAEGLVGRLGEGGSLEDRVMVGKGPGRRGQREGMRYRNKARAARWRKISFVSSSQGEQIVRSKNP
jgi:hypothetical protein